MEKKKNILFYKNKLKIFRQDLAAKEIGIHPSFLCRLLAGKHPLTDEMRSRFDLFLQSH